MPGIILPETTKYRMRMERLEARHGELIEFDRALKDIDPRLSLVKASESADEPGLEPGFWHIKRDNEQTLPSYLPLKGPNGEFMEPHSGFLEWLRACDLQRPGAIDQLRKKHANQARERERDRVRWREELDQEFATRLKAYDNPGVSFGGKGWTNRAGARKG